jgi:hypothetical protein
MQAARQLPPSHPWPAVTPSTMDAGGAAPSRQCRRAAVLTQHLAPSSSPLCPPARPPRCAAVRSGGCASAADGAAPSSTVSCACGKIEILFHVPKPLNRLPCCCWDCRQKCLWAESEGGPPVPDAVKEYSEAMDLIYFPAAFELYDLLPDLHPKGLDALEFYTLRQDDGDHVDQPGWRGDKGSLHMVATCCMTVMLVDNVNYHRAKNMDTDDGQQLLVFPAVTNIFTEIIPTSSALNFPADFPEVFLPALQEKMADAVRSGAAVEPKPRAEQEPLEVPLGCTTFTQLRLAKGTPTVNLDLEPGADPLAEDDDGPLRVD